MIKSAFMSLHEKWEMHRSTPNPSSNEKASPQENKK